MVQFTKNDNCFIVFKMFDDNLFNQDIFALCSQNFLQLTQKAMQ